MLAEAVEAAAALVQTANVVVIPGVASLEVPGPTLCGFMKRMMKTMKMMASGRRTLMMTASGHCRPVRPVTLVAESSSETGVPDPDHLLAAHARAHRPPVVDAVVARPTTVTRLCANLPPMAVSSWAGLGTRWTGQ